MPFLDAFSSLVIISMFNILAFLVFNLHVSKQFTTLLLIVSI